MNELALFAGAGGGILGGILNGWRTVCAVEIDEYCQRILMQRQNDGILEPFPIWPDVRTFDGKPWAGCVDIVTGGFPCTDISEAGKRRGITGENSGLWKEMARIIGEVRPQFVFVENSPKLNIRGLGTVLIDLSLLGFNAEWGTISAENAKAPHIRKRLWILGYANGVTSLKRSKPKMQRGWTDKAEQAGLASRRGRKNPWEDGESFKPAIQRVVNGVPCRLDRYRATGNAQVPAVVSLAWSLLSDF